MNIRTLKDTHKGETAWIVGLGPSIARLTEACFDRGPIIALNQAIVQVQRLNLGIIYSMQKDDDPPAYVIPKFNVPVILHELESAKTFPDYELRYVFHNPRDFSLHQNTISIITASEIARMMGCVKIKYVCCDVHAKGVLNTYIPEEDGLDYVDCGVTRNAFLEGQRIALRWYLRTYGVDASFIIPGEEEITLDPVVVMNKAFYTDKHGNLCELR